jgi:hypothetical protein
MQPPPQAEQVVTVIAGVVLAVPLLMWYLNLRRFGFRIFRSIRAMIRYVKGSVNAVHFILIQACIVIPGIVLAFNAATSELYFGLPNYLWALVLCLACTNLLFLLQPPVILFLSMSKRENLMAIHSLRWSIGPWRIIYLLEYIDKLDDSFSVEIIKQILKGGVRQRRGQDWRPVVHELMDTVPVIVLDAREATQPVVEEAKRILSSTALSDKCIVVSGDHGETPAVTQAANEMTERRVVQLQVVALKQLAEAITLRVEGRRH